MQSQVTIRDRQTYPFIILPKAFFALKPSKNAITAYTAIKFYARNDGKSADVSIPVMARTVDLSIRSFQYGVQELVKKKALKVLSQGQKLTNGKRLNLPNIYEILDLHPKESI
jgi:hypothetical protein